MLRPTIGVKQDPLDTDTLYITDTTDPYDGVIGNPNGYGGPHVTRAEVSYVALSLTDPSGKWWMTGPLNWKPTSSKLDILSADFKPAEQAPSDAADPCIWTSPRQCYRPGPLNFADGLYDLTYEVYGKKGIPGQSKTYHLAVRLCKNEAVWVKRMGAWVELTSFGKQDVRGNWKWTVKDTLVVYEDYQVRSYYDPNTYKIVEKGLVQSLTNNDPAQPMTTSTDPQLVGAVTVRFMLTGLIAKRIAKLARHDFREFMDLNSGCDSLSALAFTRQQLDTLIAGNSTDEQAPLLLVTIVSAVDSLELELN